MKKQIALGVLATILLLGMPFHAFADQVATLNGNGIGWYHEWGPSGYNTDAKSTPVNMSLDLAINGLNVEWVLTVQISEFGIDETFTLDNTNGGLDSYQTYVTIWGNKCWGGDYCTDDSSQKGEGEEGNSNINVLVDLGSSTGYMNFNTHDNITDPDTGEQSGKNMNFMGEFTVNLL